MNSEIRNKLISLADIEYKKFTSSLMPTVNRDMVLGVRVPELRKLSRILSLTDFENYEYLYHEEKLLHAFVISNISDFDLCISETVRFLPSVDNWAICDSFRPKCFKKNKEELLYYIDRWLENENSYTVRFGIGMLMCHYLDGNFREEYHRKVMSVKREEYYINMMISWYFATALAKQYDKTIGIFISHKLDLWVHNKALQKAIESNRISPVTKDYLRTLKREV